MKKSLLFSIVIIAAFSVSPVKSQIVLLTENFAGFTTGTHSEPATYDYSVSLDSKTQVPGWAGFKINSAGGEVKIGTADVTGWIQTPAIDLSGYDGKFRVQFDICRWPGDATTVQVLLNGAAIGSNLTPGDSYEAVTIDGTGGIVNSRIKIQSLSKRFYLDNFSVTVNYLTTGVSEFEDLPETRIYPVPADKILHISEIQHVTAIEICDLRGRTVRIVKKGPEPSVQIEIADLDPGFYFARLRSHRGIQLKRFLKI